MSATPSPGIARRLLVPLIAVVLLIPSAAFAMFKIAEATDQPAFCAQSCHEMQPYHAAWQRGAHADVACIECHVDPGTVNRLSHKVVALEEVWSHYTKQQAFPLAETTHVPDARCVACHQNVTSTTPGFDHVRHASGHRCQDCHAAAGHEVTAASLAQAGILNPIATPDRAAETTSFAGVGGGSANVQGHVDVPCSSCHDMAATGCERCHTPRHGGAGDARKTATCTTCHSPGESFVFTHPVGQRDCASCHEVPSDKHDFGSQCRGCHLSAGKDWSFTHGKRAECAACHDRPTGHRAGACSKCHSTGGSWSFKHPGASAECTSCHARPSGHRSGSCSKCHSAGRSWAFRHPSTSSCTSCHARPSGHRSGSCSKCHSAGRSWAFRHPSASTCTSCHARPSGHRSGSCSKCHRSRSSWRFSHPSSSRCSSCHKAPSSHYGSGCASCHSPGRSWGSASFSHPRIPGGEHSYRSFACTNCHPSGYSSHTCSKCHGSANGPRDEDDD